MDFRDLDALHTAHDLLIEIYDISQSFPADNQFTLGDSICATALEIPAILAEGCAQKKRLRIEKIDFKSHGSYLPTGILHLGCGSTRHC